MKYSRCPVCGFEHPKNPPNRPKKFTAEQEKQIAEDYFTLKKTVKIKMQRVREISSKWNCCDSTTRRIIKEQEENDKKS